MTVLYFLTGLFTAEVLLALVTLFFVLWVATFVIYLKSRRHSKRKIHKLLGRLAVKSNQTAKAMFAHEERFCKLVEHMNEGLFLINSDNEIVYANQCACDILKRSNEQVIGRKLSVFAVGASETSCLDGILRKRIPGGKCREELHLIRGDNEMFWASLSFSYPQEIKDINGAAIVVMTDISDHIRLENKMHKYTGSLVQKVRQQNCMFAMQDLISNPELATDEIFRRALKIIPEGLRYGGEAGVEIVFQGKRFASPGFHLTEWSFKTPIKVGNQNMGHILVSYSTNGISNQIKPFRVGEKIMIKSLADKLAHVPAVQQAVL